MGRGERKRHRQLQRLQQQQQPTPPSPTLSPPNPTHAMVRQWMASLSVSSYAGPLPPPDVLQKYNDIEPGLVNRIVAMAESQAQHRHSLEATVIRDRSRAERLGLILGSIIAMTALLGSFSLIGFGKDSVGIAGVLGTVTTLGGVFVYGRYSQKRENEEKRAAIVQPPDVQS